MAWIKSRNTTTDRKSYKSAKKSLQTEEEQTFHENEVASILPNGISDKGKSTLMIYDRHHELQSKWDKAFWARGYYAETIGNITDEAVLRYIKEQAEEARKEDSRSTAL